MDAQAPEKITVYVYVVSIAALIACFTVFALDEPLTQRELPLSLIGASAALFTVQYFTAKPKHYLVTLFFQTVIVITIVHMVDVVSPPIGVVLVIALTLSVCIRLPICWSIPVSGFIIAIQTTAWSFGRLDLRERLITVIVQIVVASFCILAVRYRELLVDTRQELGDRKVVIDNISAANESFVEHLPDIRRQSAEQERLRITRELHDTLGYSMTNIVMIMNAAQYLSDTDLDKVRDYCRRTRDLASDTMDETRQTLYRLRSIDDRAPDDPAGFFGKFCRDFHEATGITVECHPGNLRGQLCGAVFHVLLRALQVGFINALRHGKATLIRLFFWIDDSGLRMTIWNSVSDQAARASGLSEGIGLRGTRERLRELDGQMTAAYTVDGYEFSIVLPAKVLDGGQTPDPDC